MEISKKTFLIAPIQVKTTENFEWDNDFFTHETDREYLARGFFDNDLNGFLNFDNVLVRHDHFRFGYPDITIIKKNNGNHLRTVLSANNSKILFADNDEVIIEHLVSVGICPSTFGKLGDK